MNNTLNLQGERLGLFNPITGLDNKSFAKVKKNVKRLIHDLQRGKMESDSKKRSTSNLCPVSYTHLDVYKRQPLRRR